MDAKDLRVESGLGDRNDGSKYSHGEVALQCNRNKTYRDIGCNPLAKAEALVPAHVRPCAVIEPDRVAPPPASNDAYLKKSSVDPWRPCSDSLYPRPPEYTLKPQSTVSPSRNISPRQTFQENMPRILVPPTYSAVQLADESNINHVQDRNAVLSKNPKQTMAPEAKYCEVPYAVNVVPNEHKTAREVEMCAPSVNSPVSLSGPHVWPPGVNLHTPRAYGAHDIYQYPQYPSCAGPRPPVIPVARPPRTYQEEAGFAYPDSYYQDASVRFKPYPSVKERYPQARYDFISNYPNPFHPPPYAAHKFDIPSTRASLPYPVYPHLKYLDSRVPDHGMDGYQRPNQQPPLNYNTPFHNQVNHPTYAPLLRNAQNRVPTYPPDALIKSSSKPTYDNNKSYVDYENAKTKYPDSYFLNELARVHHVQKSNSMPNYTAPSIHPIPMQYHRKDNIAMKTYEYNIPHYRHFEHQGLNSFGPQPQFSPSTLAISPTDSNTSNDGMQTQTNTQEDCGYASQSSTTSVKSIDSLNRLSNEYHRRYDHRYRQITGNSHLIHKPESTPKDNQNINVRQFWSMWNEGEEEQSSNNSPKGMSIPKSVDNNNYIHHDRGFRQQATKTRDQLYVLGQVNVPNEELAKYEHIQKVSKLPENIKGYNSIELLNQFEEVIESSKRTNFTHSNNEFAQTIKDRKYTMKQVVEVPPRPVSPLDVESKISQSIIHKDVGCNFDIKPCSPKMLNVEIAAPVQNILGERSIEKISNPLTYKAKSPLSMRFDSNTGCNKIQRQRSTPTPYENSSCKMVGSPFNSNNMESIKADYSLQDLETSSGVCLASLPRLDNEIELNFPEVNQQFINANKYTSTPQNLQDIYSNEVTKSNIELALSVSDSKNDSVNCTILPVDDENVAETKKLSNNKKSKTYHSDPVDKESNANAIRTDSVIIENPENVRRIEENKEKYESYKPIEVEPIPLNLTSQSASHVKECDSPIDHRKHRMSECALDYSLSKNEHDFYVYNDNLIQTTQNEQCTSDITATSCLLSDDHIEINNVDGQTHNISKLSTECDSNVSILKTISNKQSDCGLKVKDGTTYFDFQQNVTLETHERSVCKVQIETTKDKIMNENKRKTNSDNLTMKHKHKHKNKHKTSKVKTIPTNRFNQLRDIIQNSDEITSPSKGSNSLNISKTQKQISKSVIQINNLSEAEKIETTVLNGAETSSINSHSSLIADTNSVGHNSVDEKSNVNIISIAKETIKSQIGLTKNLTEVKSITVYNEIVSDDYLSTISDPEDVVNSEMNDAHKYYTDLISEGELFIKSTNAINYSPNSLAHQDLTSAVLNNSVDVTDAKDLFCIKQANPNILKNSRHVLDDHKVLRHPSSIPKLEVEYQNKKLGLDSQSEITSITKCKDGDDIVINPVGQCDSKEKEGNSCEGLSNTNNSLVDKAEITEMRLVTDDIKNDNKSMVDMNKINRVDSGYKSSNNSYAELEDRVFENYIHLNDDSVFVDHESNSKQLALKNSFTVDKNKKIEQQSCSDTDTYAFKSKERVNIISSEDSKMHNKVEMTTCMHPMNELDTIDANMRIIFEDTNVTSSKHILSSSKIVDDSQILLQVKNYNKEFKDSQSLPGIQNIVNSSHKMETNLNIDSTINKNLQDKKNKTLEIELMEVETDGNIQLSTEVRKDNKISYVVFTEEEKDTSVSDTAGNADRANQFTEKTKLKVLTNKSKYDNDRNPAHNLGVDKIAVDKFAEETCPNVITNKENGTSFLHTAECFGVDETDVKESTIDNKNSNVPKHEVKVNGVRKPNLNINVDESDANNLIDQTILKPLMKDVQKNIFLEMTEIVNANKTNANQLNEKANIKPIIEDKRDTIVLGTTEYVGIGDTASNELNKQTCLKALPTNKRHDITLGITDAMSVDETDSNEFIKERSLKSSTDNEKGTIALENTTNFKLDKTNLKELIEETNSKALTGDKTDAIVLNTTDSLSVGETDSNEFIKEMSLNAITEDEKDIARENTTNLCVDESDANEFLDEIISKAFPKDEKNTIVLDTNNSSNAVETNSNEFIKGRNLNAEDEKDTMGTEKTNNSSVHEIDANELIDETISKAVTGDESDTIVLDTIKTLSVGETDSNEFIEETRIKVLMEDNSNSIGLDTTTNFNVDETNANELIDETILKTLTGDNKNIIVLDTSSNLIEDETYANKTNIIDSLSIGKTDSNDFIKEENLKVITENKSDSSSFDTTTDLSVNETDANKSIDETILKALTGIKINIVPETTSNLIGDKTDKNETDIIDSLSVGENDFIKEKSLKVLMEDKSDSIISLDTTTNLSVNETDANDSTANLVWDKTDANKLIKETISKVLTGDKNDNIVRSTTVNLGVYKSDINESLEETSLKALIEDEREVIVPQITNTLNEKCINVQPVSKIVHVNESPSKVFTEKHNGVNVQANKIIETKTQCKTNISKVSDKTNAKIITEKTGMDDAIFTASESKIYAKVFKNKESEIMHVDKLCSKEVFNDNLTLKDGINIFFAKELLEKEKHKIIPTNNIICEDKTISKTLLTEKSNIYNIHGHAAIETLIKEKSDDINYINDLAETETMQADEHCSNILTLGENISISQATMCQIETEVMTKNNIDTIKVQPYFNPTTYGYRGKELHSPQFQNLLFNNEGNIFKIKNSKHDNNQLIILENENFQDSNEITCVNNAINTVIFESDCAKSYTCVSMCGNSDNILEDNILPENTACENKLTDNIHDLQLKDLVDIENCDVSYMLDSTVEIGTSEESSEKKQNNNKMVKTDLTHSQGISFQYPNNSVVTQITEKIFITNDNGKDDIKCKVNNGLPIKRRQSLKRSYSDSALNAHVSRDDHKENIRNLHYSWLAKRNKCELESILSNNRRNSVNVGENISFCILIDDNCIIEESEDKICIAEIEEDYITEINLENDACTFAELNTSEHETNVGIVDTELPECDDVTSICDAWVENVACVDTVFSDEVAENVVISTLSSPTNSTSEYDHTDSEIYDRSTSSHTDKVKLMLGEKMSEDDAHIVDTLYRTPHMNIMNKTLLYGEKNVETDDDLTDDSSDDVDQDRILIEPNDWKPSLTHTPDYIDPTHTLNDFRLETPENKENVFVKDLSPLRKIDDYLDVSSAENETDEHAMSQHVTKTIKTSQNEKMSSCESSLDSVYENTEIREYTNSNTSSSSPEVSSTTSEDKNSTILLKITNLNGSRVSEINEIKTNNRPRCKFTEKKEYSNSNYRFPNRPLLTKAAQKYIPPIKETIRDLKVKITLPQHSLLKFKQLKTSRNEPKINKQSNVIPRIAKKSKPNFDDVLKSIDEMQRKKHIEKSKKSKSIVPKVVIKKNMNGSHYASTPKKDTFNPDLTGRRWQPWVFLEKSHFIDKMAIKNQTRAIYNYRKKTYVLKESFKKYKSVSNTKFVISQPKTPGQLKYTIRLKHTY